MARKNMREIGEQLQAALKGRHYNYTLRDGDPGFSVWLECGPGRPCVLLKPTEDGRVDVTVYGIEPRTKGIGFQINGTPPDIARLADVLIGDLPAWSAAEDRRLEARSVRP